VVGFGPRRLLVVDLVSPRYVPDEIIQVTAVPRTLTGKKLELPIKKLLLGHAVEKVINRDVLANPESIDWFIEFERKLNAR
jgi:acetoacetyl-CoA synthetase